MSNAAYRHAACSVQIAAHLGAGATEPSVKRIASDQGNEQPDIPVYFRMPRKLASESGSEQHNTP